MQIKRRKRRIPDGVKQMAVADYNAGIAVQTILEKYDMSKATLYNTLRELEKTV